jgi:hypothetical protein
MPVIKGSYLLLSSLSQLSVACVDFYDFRFYCCSILLVEPCYSTCVQFNPCYAVLNPCQCYAASITILWRLSLVSPPSSFTSLSP